MTSSIFKKPTTEINFPYKVLFFHGMEGSPQGSKALYLRKKWGALCPPVRTSKIKELNASRGLKPWSSVGKEDINSAMEETMADARDAINYKNPDIIIGSSMGGALLMKLIVEGTIDTSSTVCVFLAPAINELVSNLDSLPKILGSSWLLAEIDENVNNDFNISCCFTVGGNLMISPDDDHRLGLALEAGLIDSSILTAIEFSERFIKQREG